MSEPTSGGKEQPDPDRNQDQHEEVQDEVQDQISGSDFNDPTAPVWADPTAPTPAPPAPPGAAHPQGQQPASSPQAAPQAPPPMSNPYAQQPPAQPYGQPNPYAQQPPAPTYGQPQAGQQYPAYGQQYPAYGQQTYATGPTTEANASAIVLTILSGIIMLSTCFVIGIPGLVFGIMALTSNNADPVGSRKKAKTGWILFAVNVGVVVLLAVAAFALLIAGGASSYDNNFSY